MLPLKGHATCTARAAQAAAVGRSAVNVLYMGGPVALLS